MTSVRFHGFLLAASTGEAVNATETFVSLDPQAWYWPGHSMTHSGERASLFALPGPDLRGLRPAEMGNLSGRWAFESHGPIGYRSVLVDSSSYLA